MIQSSMDTIAALATPCGRGSLGVIRVSGPQTKSIAKSMLGHLPKARYASYLPFLDAKQNTLDQGIALFFQGPHSYTGEDVLELQGHGGPQVMDAILQRVLKLGARMAQPGEFSERAFLNNKMDLLQCEAVSALINAGSKQAMRAAMRSLKGDFSNHVNALVEALTRLRMYVEAAIDFPEEEIDFLQDEHIATALADIESQLSNTLTNAGRGVRLQEGLKMVIIGKPNAGKSSLLNQLTRENTAIVTDVPGTTRDLIKAQLDLDGLPTMVVDTAGLRHSDDLIEQEGIRRANAELNTADLVLVIVDGSKDSELNPYILFPETMSMMSKEVPVVVVKNKIDLTNEVVEVITHERFTCVSLSAMDGLGISTLIAHIKAVAGLQPGNETDFIARRRHLDGLEQAWTHVKQAAQVLEQQSGELVAEELRLAQVQLAVLTGQVSSDDLLGRIFSEFCIGK